MRPSRKAPRQIIDHVRLVQALDSVLLVIDGGPNITTSTVLVPLPAGWKDSSPLKYHNADLAFAVLYTVGKGNVILIGHSASLEMLGADWPSAGQIEVPDNLRFLMNCVAYLADRARKAR